MAFNGFNEFKNGNITKEQLEQQWEEYKTNFRETEIEPLLATMQQAKDAYFTAYYALIDAKKQFIADNSRATSKEFNLKPFSGFINIEAVHNPESFITKNDLNGLYAYSVEGSKRTFKGVNR